jgi:hypothetical protein
MHMIRNTELPMAEHVRVLQKLTQDMLEIFLLKQQTASFEVV